MAKHTLKLTEAEIQALVELRDKGKPAYLRERATAMLKIHTGWSPHKVAHQGLLKKRDPDICLAPEISRKGISGLSRPGRGRFRSSRVGTLDTLGMQLHQTRWTLRSLRYIHTGPSDRLSLGKL